MAIDYSPPSASSVGPVASVFTPVAAATVPVPQSPVPAAGALGTGNAPKETFLTGLLDPSSPTYLGARYTGARQAAGATLKAGLAGLGGYTITDNPDGTSSVSFDPSKAGTGDRETAAVSQSNDANNARGTLYSSFAQGDASAALQRLTEAGRAVVGKYASDINRINGQESTDWTNTVGSLAGLYGQDASWLAQNPPPATSPAATPAAPVAVKALPKATVKRLGTGNNQSLIGSQVEVPTRGPLIDFVRAHYAPRNVPGVYRHLFATGFTPPAGSA